MKKLISAILLFATLGTSVAVAGPIEDRQALMKEIAKAAKAANAISKAPTFDAAAAKAQMDIIAADAAKIPGLFPPGSDKGATKTKATPAVWTDAAGFKADAESLAADATAAGTAADAASFTTAFKKMQRDCGACHMNYRQPDE